MKKVSIKVAAKLPALALALTDAFKEVIINYGEESVVAFTESVKAVKQVNKDAFDAIGGVDVAVGLVSMIVEHEGSFINKNPKLITEQLNAIAAKFDGVTEDLPDTMEQWLTIAGSIIIVDPKTLVVDHVKVGEEQLEDKDVTVVLTPAVKTPETLTPEETKALEDAVGDFAETIVNIAKEVESVGNDIIKEQMVKEKEKKESLATDILTGVAVVTGVVVVGAGLYYAYKGLFGDDKFEGWM